MNRRARAFVPLWRPPEGGYAGGLVRAKHILERQRNFDLLVVDTDSTDIDASKVRGELRRLPLSWAYASRGAAFRVMRLLNWFLHAIAVTCVGLLAKGPFDFVYVPFSEILPIALAGLIVGRARGIPVIFCNLNVRGVLFWQINRALHRQADYIITLSRSLAAEIREERIAVPVGIGLVGVDDDSIPSRRPQYDAVFVGRHTPEKGIFDAIDIWARCCARVPSLRLALAGPCSDEIRTKLDTEIAARSMTANVAILGSMSEPAKWELYAASRSCLFPSHVEGWGIVPIEAHLAGLPVVAYDLDAYQETIRDSPAAKLVPIGDAEAAADAVLATLARDPDVGAMQAWARQFTWDRAVAREIALIEKVLARQAITPT